MTSASLEKSSAGLGGASQIMEHFLMLRLTQEATGQTKL